MLKITVIGIDNKEYCLTIDKQYSSIKEILPEILETFQISYSSQNEYSLEEIDVNTYKINKKINIFEKIKKTHIFISYSHKDKQYLQRLQVHLKPLEREGLVDIWDDTKLRTGDIWKEEINTILKKTRIAILLVSADFLASDFIVNNELPSLLQKAESGGTKILPVILSSCRFDRDKDLSSYQTLNPLDKPISSMKKTEQEEIWDKLSKEIEVMINGEVVYEKNI